MPAPHRRLVLVKAGRTLGYWPSDFKGAAPSGKRERGWTMNSRERVERTLNHQPVDRAPRDFWALPGVTVKRREEWDRLRAKYPGDLQGTASPYGRSKYAKGRPYEVGAYTDEFGCVWEVAEYGVVGEVKHPPLADWSALASYRMPTELLDEADFSSVDRSIAGSDRFTLGGTLIRPFERLQFLRGTESLLCDLAYDPPELRRLIGMLHEFNLREMTAWAKTDVQAVSFMDDWGSQTSLLIAPETWRAIFKPLYREYVAILRKAGKYAFFHSDGHIRAIMPDLVEIGVSAVNSQLYCMDVEEIGRTLVGKITFWGELDRQHLQPFGTAAEVRAGVRRIRRALDRNRGGLFAQCEWGRLDPYENIDALYDEWQKPLAECLAGQ